MVRVCNHDSTSERRSNDFHRQKSFSAQKGLGRELTKDVDVSRSVDARTDYAIGRVVGIAGLRSRVGAYPVEVLGEGGEGGGEEDCEEEMF